MTSLTSRTHRHARSGHTAAKRRAFRPLLEALEDRVVPVTRTWTGAGLNDLWSNPANWVAGVPLAGDDVRIASTVDSAEVLFDASAAAVSINTLTSDGTNPVGEPFRITGSTLTMSGLGTFSLGAGLTLSGGTLAGTGVVSVAGTTTWTGGNITNTGELITNGPLAITANDQDLNQHKLTVNGGAVMDGAGAIDGLNAAPVNVNSLFDMQSDADFNFAGGTTPVINISAGGTLRKSVAGGLTEIDFLINNAGTSGLHVQSGTLRVQGGGTSTGNFSIDTGRMLDFAAGTHNLNTGASVGGAGSVHVTGATVNANAGSSYNAAATFISSGTANFNGSSTTGALTLNGGTLGGTGTLAVSGATVWTGGNMTQGGELITNGPLAMTANDQDLNQHKLTVNGGAVMDGAGAIDGLNTAIVNVNSLFDMQTDADFNFAGGTTSIINIFVGGTVRKSVAGGLTEIDYIVNNAGTGLPTSGLHVQSGTVQLRGGGTSTGNFSIDTGAILDFALGTHNLNAGASLGGAGPVHVTGATVNANAGSNYNAAATVISSGTANFNGSSTTGALTLSGGTLGGTGTLTANGATSWTGSNTLGAGELITNGPLAITANDQDHNQHKLTINGGAIMDGPGAIDGLNAAQVNVNSLFDIQSDADFNFAGGTVSIVNILAGGTLRKSVAGGLTEIDFAFNNAGTGLPTSGLHVQSGTVQLRGGGTSIGNFSIDSAAILDFALGTHNLNSGGSVGGTGPVHVTGATVNVNAGSSYNASATIISGGTANFNGSSTTGALTLSGGTLGGTGTLTASGATSWTGGNTLGAGELITNGPLAITANDQDHNQHKLTINGGAIMDGPGAIDGLNAAQVNVNSLFDIRSDADFNFAGGTVSILNILAGGTLRKSVGTDVSFIDFNVTNNAAGTIDVRTGTLSLDGTFSNFAVNTLTGGTYLVTSAPLISSILRFNGANIVTNAATIVLDGALSQIVNALGANGLAGFATNNAAGNFTIQNGRDILTPAFTNAGNVTIGAGSTFTTSALNYTQSGGSTTVLGSLDPAGIVNIQGGTLRGTGTIEGNLTNAGTVIPGLSPGILTVNGNYTGTGSGALNVDLNGAAAGTGYDQLKVSGTVSLTNTTLNLTRGFNSAVGTTFTIIDNTGGAAVSGTFNGLTEGSIITLGGPRYQISYAGGDGNDVVLTHINTAPIITTVIGNRIVDEETLLTFTATASDVDAPPGTMSFSLDAGFPAGAAIDPDTGVFTWTPTEAQGPGNYSITVRVSDSGLPVLSAFETITVTVNEVNRPPVLAVIADQAVNEGSPVSFTAMATDPDLPANTLTFSLDAVAPAWAAIDGTMGLFTGTPPDGPASHTITVRVTDNGSPTLNATRTFVITVTNVAPTIALTGTASVAEGSLYTLNLGAVTDPGADTVSQYIVHWGDGSTDTYASAGNVTHTYADGPASRTITVDLVDEDGTHANAGSLSLTVNNVAPIIALTGAASVAEGSLYTLNLGAVTDPGADTVSQYIVHWGDGSSNTYASAGNVTHTYADGPASRTITVDLVDEDGTHANAGSVSLTVTNVAPTIALTGAASVAEGSLYTLNLGAVTDPGADTVSQYIVHWGDGSIDTYASAGNVTHTYADGPASRTITVDLVDEDGTHANAGSLSLTVNNVAPIIALTGAASVAEGSLYTLNLGAVTDPGADTVSQYIVHWGDGSSNTYASAGNVTHTYADGSASRTITVDLVDEDGTHTNAGSLSLSVNNVAPTIALTGAASVAEGSLYTLNLGAVTDPGADTVSQYIVHWGDGSTDTYASAGNVTHTYADGPASRAITVDLVDEDGTHANAGSLLLTVNNVAPTIVLTGAAIVAEGSPYTLNLGAVTDPGADTVSQYIVHWGDGSTDTYASAGNVTHTYADPGTPTITVDLVDEDGTHANAGSLALTVINVDRTIALSGAASVAEGLPYTLTLGPVSGEGAVSQYIVHWGDGSTDTYSSAGDVTHTYADGPASRTITVDLVDEDGTHANAGSLSLTVNDVAPTITLTGPSNVTEGAAYTLNLGAVSDPGADTISQYVVYWGDGSSNTFGSGGNVGHTYADGPATRTIVVDLVDEDGTHAAAGTLGVAVDNAAPTAGITGPANANAGQTIGFTLSATDLPADQAAGFTFSIDWDGDDIGDQTVTGPSGVVVTHSFADAGSHEIAVTATDKDGGVSDLATHVVLIDSGSGGSGTAEMVGDDLVITGTDGDDVITVRRGRECGSVVVRINGVRFGPFTPAGRIIAHGLGGNDRITVGSNVALPATLDGGDGNDFLRGGAGDDELLGGGGDDELVAVYGDDALDGGPGNDLLRAGAGCDMLLGGDGNDELRGAHGGDILDGGSGDDLLRGGQGDDILRGGSGKDALHGGAGSDILLGGDGDDLLIGGEGRDLLIGGFGADTIRGNAQEDILIAGYTAHDANDTALLSLMKEWTSCADYSTRIAHITAGTGLTDGYRLVGDDGASQTVFNDNDVDTLTGNQGQDWFFANRIADNGAALDVVTDKAASEVWSDTDY